MTAKPRYLSKQIHQALLKKMVFIGGPRQVGKTTVSLEFISPSSPTNNQYLNWDNIADKQKILKFELPLDKKTLIFDEIHKYKNWRGFIKGLFDTYHEQHRFIVTGSARLDFFRKGGDSLLGRYRYFRLHPFSLPEFSKNLSNTDLKKLLQFGGFPEPLFLMTPAEHKIWQRDRMQKVVGDDLRDLERVNEISQLLMLAEILPSRVGSPLSLNSLSEDLQVSQPTIARWNTILSNLYYTYLVSPFGAPKIRAVKKLQKVYMWDWSLVPEEGPRFENLVASHLLKYCHYIEDTEGDVMELRYLRDTDGKEIDFVVIKNRKPIFAVECKTGDKQLSKNIQYFKQRTTIPLFYQVHMKEKDYGAATTGRVLPFATFCRELRLV